MSTRRSSSRKISTTSKITSTTTEAYRQYTSEHSTESTLRSSTSDKFMPTFEGDYETVDKHKVCHNHFSIINRHDFCDVKIPTYSS